MIRIAQKPSLAEKIVIVNGVSGCGKTMLAPIVGALPRVELMQFSYALEWTCALRHLGRLDGDPAAALIALITDLQLYNGMMARETNFRLSDLSSVFRNAQPWRYIRRLWRPGDEVVPERVKAERPILLLTTHNLLPVSAPLSEALGPRLLLVELVRHPLYTIIQHSIALDREDVDTGMNARSFFVMVESGGRRMPWWTQGWEDLFLRASSVDKAIYTRHHLTRLADKVVGDGEGRDGILVIPFERFVIDPWPYLHRLEQALDTHVDARTRRMLKKQNIPRKMYAEGIDLGIYRKYGWKPPAVGADEVVEFERRRRFAMERASPEAMEVLDEMCRDYERKYLRVSEPGA